MNVKSKARAEWMKSKDWFQEHRKVTYPVGVVIVAMIIALIFVATKPAAPRIEKVEKPVLVDIVVAEKKSEKINIYQQGTVIPAQEINLRAEV
ncbi:hypothetical protein OAO01_08555, partial [Oligoflexia bacterium]|nr:hypothetical protein [Oligoflexia bacterium]